MARTSAKLKSELMALALYGDEPSAIQAWANAFTNYFLDAMVGGIPVAPGSLNAAKAAMSSAMVGLSSAGAAALVSGVGTFWSTMIPTIASVFPSVISATPATGLAGLSASLAVAFSANISGSASKDVSMGRIAGAIHAACAGGIAVLPPNTPTPIL